MAERRSVEDTWVLSALTRQNSTFTRQDLAREVNLLTSNAEQFRAPMGRVEASPELVRLAGTERLSTQTMVRAEAILAATVDAMAQDASHPLDRNGLRLRAKADGLSPAQHAALTHITDAAAVSCLTGLAGAGKSYTLGMARQVWEASAYTVRGAALSTTGTRTVRGTRLAARCTERDVPRSPLWADSVDLVAAGERFRLGMGRRPCVGWADEAGRMLRWG
jgi:hypothetical protein